MKLTLAFIGLLCSVVSMSFLSERLDFSNPERLSPLSLLDASGDVSITSTTPNSVDVALGQDVVITSEVSNAGTTSEDTILYCISMVPNATLNSITVGGSTVALESLSPVGQLCYNIGPLGAGTEATVTESWTITSCTPSPSLVDRSIMCDCDDSLVCSINTPSAITTQFVATDEIAPLEMTITPGVSPLAITVCGDPIVFELSITNNFQADPDLQNIRAFLDVPPGFILDNPQGGVAFNAAMDSLIIGDLAFGETLTFNLDFYTECISDLAAINFFVVYTYDELCEGLPNIQFIESPQITPRKVSFNILTPAIQGNLRPNNVFDAVLGLSDTLKVPLTQAGSGEIDSFLYFVIDPATVANVDVLIGGVSLGVAGTSGDTTFYWVDPAAIMNSTQTGPDPGLFEENETLTVCEVWTGIECQFGTLEPIRRGALLNCGDAPCIFSNESTTGIDFGFASPLIETTRYDPLTDRPACYADEATTLALEVINTGNAPAGDISIVINQGGLPGSIIGSTLSYSVGSDAGPFISATASNTTDATGTVGSTGQCALGDDLFRSLTADMLDVNLAPGDTLYFTYQLSHGCDCRACIIDNIYESSVTRVDWTTLCDVELSDNDDIDFPQFDARLQGFFEGESFASSTGCFTYQITNGSATWMNSTYRDEYPDAYFESRIVAECGMDITSVTNINASGNPTASTSIISNMDGELGVDDIIIARTTNNINGVIEICYQLDCREKPGPSCPTSSSISIENFFVADPSCVSTCQANVSCPSSIAFTYNCTPCGPCDGLSIRELDINRTNFCFLDADNDFIPDDGTIADATTAKGKRFVQGDTLSAMMTGVVNATTITSFDHAFLEFNVQTDQFSILGGEFTVFDASDGSTRVCNALSQMAIDSLYITDLSPATFLLFIIHSGI